jgi:hypothetical protein
MTKKSVARGKKTKAERPIQFRPTLDAAIGRAVRTIAENPEIRRAAERANGKSSGHVEQPIPFQPVESPANRAIDFVIERIRPDLVHATELAGETLASMLGVHDGTQKSVAELNALLWRLRWELGLAAKAVSSDHGDDASAEQVSS